MAHDLIVEDHDFSLTNKQGRMRRNVGWRDDPGVRMLEKKPPGASVSASAVGRVVSEVFSMTSGT